MHDLTIYEKFNEIIKIKTGLKNNSFDSNKRKIVIGIINHCLNSVEDDFGLILRKTYFENSYKFWWLDYFSKSTFYRKRFRAISLFVHLFEMIYENIDDLSIYMPVAC